MRFLVRIEKKIGKEHFLTSSTAEGFRVTITSTLELCDYLLEMRKFNYVLTNKINQDPLEVPAYMLNTVLVLQV